jgi:hypothetical protein
MISAKLPPSPPWIAALGDGTFKNPVLFGVFASAAPGATAPGHADFGKFIVQ